MKELVQKVKKLNLTNALYPIIGVGLFVLIWFIVAKIIGVEMILPTPIEAMERLFALLGTSDFWLAVSGTLGRALYSFVLSSVFAIILAVVSYVLPVVAKTLSPIVVILRSVPTMSIILLALIWLDSKSAPILIAFLILFPQLYASFLSALNGVSEELIDMSKAYKVPVFKRIMGLYIPEILPSSLDAMKSSVSFGVKITIAGEVLAQTFNSMGVSMQISKSYFDTAELLGWTIMAILLSYGLEGVFSLIKYFAVRRKV